MSDELNLPEHAFKNGRLWHLAFTYDPTFPYPFPVTQMGIRTKQDAVGHLSEDGNVVHIFNAEIIEQLVRAGLRAQVQKNEANSEGGYNEK